MGLLRDIGMLVGILPIERPNFKKRISEEEYPTKYKLFPKTERLNELNGKYVWVTDAHNGIVAGELVYKPIMGDNYLLNNCSISGDCTTMHIHDLKSIW